MNTIQRRKKEALLRKNTKLIIFLTISLWFLLGSMVFLIDPDTPWAKLLFFLVLFAASLITFSTLFINSRRGLLASIFVCIFASLRMWGVGTLFNALLLLLLAIITDIYLTNQKN